MKYMLQVVIILIAFYAGMRAKRLYKKAIETEIVDWGRYKLEPLQGEKAVRLAKFGIIWITICCWGTVIVIFLYDLLDLIRQR